jgi:uncharacterized protein
MTDPQTPRSLRMTELACWRERPEETPVMFQTWKRLLFLHWRVDPELVQARLPAGLTVETIDGDAWMAIVPFEMRNIRPRLLPAVPHLSNFLELNVRTYVTDERGIPGVWFFSLNANRRLAVTLGRKWFALPYHRCRMRSVTDAEGWTDYSCRRLDDPDGRHGRFVRSLFALDFPSTRNPKQKSSKGPRRVERHLPTNPVRGRTCCYRYRPVGEPAPAEEGSLEFFLVERYILFAQLPDGELATGQVHHAPYRIQSVKLEEWDEQQFAIDGFFDFGFSVDGESGAKRLPGRPPDHALYSPGVDVEVFELKRLSDDRMHHQPLP